MGIFMKTAREASGDSAGLDGQPGSGGAGRGRKYGDYGVPVCCVLAKGRIFPTTSAMQYRKFGNTGIEVSALGFGAMRLPMDSDKDGKSVVKEEESIAMIHRAFELGVNYIDTAHGYCEGQSEIIVGKAVKQWKGRVYVATKNPTWSLEKPGDYRRFLEEQLEKLDLDCIDFYHNHGLGKTTFEERIKKHHVLEEAQQAKEEGLIRHISFSFHDKPEVMKEIIDTGIYESVLCQYNLLDRSNEEAMAYAREKGLGVAVMGPVGGGRLGLPSKTIQEAMPGGEVKATPEIALRFVLANPDVCVACSGMSSMQMAEDNCAVASNETPMSAEELATLKSAMEESKKLAELYCTGCGYCQPCPHEVNIPKIFEFMNYHRVYQLTDYAREHYAKIGKAGWLKGKNASACVECGECEPKCPQNIEIIKQLKESHAALG